MIKNVKWIFVVLIISSLISFSFVGKNTPTEGLTIGDKAPTFTICGEKQLIDLKDLRGKYVLLSFWASYDALSRMQNATLNHAIAQADNVEMVSVSFDEYKSIFNETIKKTRYQLLIVLWNWLVFHRIYIRLIAWKEALRTFC